MKKSGIRWLFIIIGALTLYEIVFFFFGPIGMEKGGHGVMDYLVLGYLLLHVIFLLRLRPGKKRHLFRILLRSPEVLLVIGLVLFLFSYIYASNANMDYIQRFAASSGNIHLAPDSRIQRLNSMIQFLPFLIIDAAALVWFRVKFKQAVLRVLKSNHFSAVWGLPSVLLSAFLYTLALPSFAALDGIFILAFICLIPLYITIRFSSYGWGVFYGLAFGLVQTMLANYWLGTFSLVSLQFVTGVYFIYYGIFMTFFVWLLKYSGRWSFLVFPAGWVVFDLLRSSGFLGYPWAMLGVSQYAVLPLIQIASLTGVWGVSFIVIAVNSALAHLFLEGADRRIRRTMLAVLAVVLVLPIIAGSLYLGLNGRGVSAENQVRVALIQQNTDPRKGDYAEELAILKRLTDEALKEKPDLVAWSETAFVPNIRRWGEVDPDTHYLAALVRDMRDYQRQTGTWLVTGNDDYEVVPGTEGPGELRLDYNAAILFSPLGERVETYHKMHLVPFTEYFPYKKQLPWFYQLLLDFDVYLWEPGKEPVVFEHPKFSFSTPICFEDSFPGDIRKFILAGADVIMNISNDFWSLTRVEAKQHFINSLFRAVENRKPLLRATASGVTAYVDTTGRVMAQLPYYTENFIVADVDIRQGGYTLYTRLGNWFPYLCGAGLLTAAVIITLKRRRPARLSRQSAD
ncbi:MAG: apolipoprotein N-acyltransferase [Spirochaetales bacterium]|nr:MAG: apolipoprotein N-acyltransferase [Spirochaetales bacterium]